MVGQAEDEGGADWNRGREYSVEEIGEPATGTADEEGGGGDDCEAEESKPRA